jgi:hypothetical protein
MMRVEDVNDHRSAQKMNSKRESTRGCSLFPRFGVDLIRASSVHLRVDDQKKERERRGEKSGFVRYAKKIFSSDFFSF